ncbi:unnamed protein product, partial [Chrysoparadoxa australica]
PFLGAVTELFLPRFNEHLSLQLEIYYLKFDYFMGRSTPTINNSWSRYFTYFTQESLLMPLSFKYLLLRKGDSGFFIQTGSVYEFQINSLFQTRIQQFSGNDIMTIYEKPQNIANQWGLMGGLGIVQTFAFFKLSLSGKYLHEFNLHEEPGIEINTRRIAIVAAIQF